MLHMSRNDSLPSCGVLRMQGIVLGAPVTWSSFFLDNLLPVTLGNIIGGAVCMATAYAICFGRLNPSTKSA